MLCKKFEKQVWDYLDGRTDEFSNHLQDCARCRNTLEKAEKLLNLLKEEAAPAPSAAYRDSFWPRLKEKIAVQEGRPQHPLSILKLNPLYYAAMTAAAAALVLWVSIREPDYPILMASSAASPNYIMAPAGSSGKEGFPAVDYISGPGANPGGERMDKIDYILPGTTTGGATSWAV